MLIAFHNLHVLWYSYYSYSVDGEMEALRGIVQGEAALSPVSLSAEPSLQKFRLFYLTSSDSSFLFPLSNPCSKTDCNLSLIRLDSFSFFLFFFLNYILNRSHNYVALLSRGCELPPALPAGHGQVQVRTGRVTGDEILTHPPTHCLSLWGCGFCLLWRLHPLFPFYLCKDDEF